MMVLEVITWLGIGALLGVLQSALYGGTRRRWHYVVAGITGAVVGGSLAHASAAGLWSLGGFSISALLLAAIFALAATVLVDASVPQGRPRA